ncbi:MAG: hypothetical protein IT376_14155 [Polyangiaceae bacterium]|nr:hypothetical protein [Polyangiaceae bacterium]
MLLSGALDPWVDTYDLSVTALSPAPGSTFGADLGGREWAYVVELSTMRIVWKGFGSYGPTTNSSALQGLVELEKALAP